MRPGVLVRGGDHQLDAVELVHLGGTRVVVDRDDVGLRVLSAQLGEHAASHHVVRQAGERLRTDDVRRPVLDQFDHLADQQPAFTGLGAQRDHPLRLGGQLGDGLGHVELAVRRGQRLAHRTLVLLDQPDAELLAGPPEVGAQTEVLPLVVGGVHALQEERSQAGQHGLAALLLDHPHCVVVGIRLELDQNLADHPDSRLARDAEQR